jgi:hypothetical protein
MTHLRLAIEPIPYASAPASLAKLLPRPEWDRIRRVAYKSASYHCQTCGNAGRLNCHELWHFNESTGYQWLMGFQALCDDCHGVRHMLSVRNRQEFDRLANHFMAVNRASPREFRDHLEQARQRRAELNQREWRIAFGDYAFRVPALKTIQERERYVALEQPRFAAHLQIASCQKRWTKPPLRLGLPTLTCSASRSS